jgi:hypothetical protein|tara:strand:- start:1029 stop:1271 length:243 start_codon:yes stop_codon:yes gene_type:complete
MIDAQEQIDAELAKIREVCLALIDVTKEVVNYNDIEDLIVAKDEIFRDLDDGFNALDGLYAEFEIAVEKQTHRLLEVQIR